MLDSGSMSIGDTGNVPAMSTQALMVDPAVDVDEAGGWKSVGRVLGLTTRGLERHRSVASWCEWTAAGWG